ncbi:hypothetical protein [Streptococcus agalactiae]|nr:hypothetical protein [Streptococcus agalactiae]MCD0131125.1 hypothetical protein [Streptococcus agalactiae]MCF1393934.1 hypothetical protein [Streptococcus agalactiae]
MEKEAKQIIDLKRNLFKIDVRAQKDEEKVFMRTACYPDSYYRYENNQVGLEDITFYMKDNKVYYLHFGKAIDKNEAKNDKYLNQIINN